MKNFTLLFFCFILFFSNACHNSDGNVIQFPTDDNPQPIFYMEGEIDGTHIWQGAGVDGVTLKEMRTDRNWEMEDVKSHENPIESKIKIGDFSFSIFSVINTNKNIMAQKPVPFAYPNKNGYVEYIIDANFDDTGFIIRPDSINWFLNDKNANNLINNGWSKSFSYLGKEYPKSITCETVYQVDSKSPKTRLRHTIENIMGNPDIEASVRFGNLTSSSVTMGLLNFQSNVGFNWDNIISTPTFALTSELWAKKRTLTVTDITNSTTKAKNEYMVGNFTGTNNVYSKAPNVSIRALRKMLGDFDKHINLQFRYKDGFTYRSDLKVQPSSSYFEVISQEKIIVEDYPNPIRKYQIAFNCRLYSDNGKYIDIKNGKGAIGFEE